MRICTCCLSGCSVHTNTNAADTFLIPVPLRPTFTRHNDDSTPQATRLMSFHLVATPAHGQSRGLARTTPRQRILSHRNRMQNCLEDRRCRQIRTRRRIQTEARIFLGFSADKGTVSHWRKPKAKFGTTER